LEACRHENRGIKIIFASTRQIYGRPDYLPVDEDHPLRPTDVNGINKLAGESYHLLYNRVHGIRACALRLTNTYGPGMRVKDARQTFLGIWIRNLVEGKPFEIFGDGKQLRDFNYVEDCVDALITAASDERCNGQIFNLGGAEVVSLHQLAELLTNLGVEGSFTVVQFPPDRKQIDIGDYYGDYSRFTKLTGWKPKTSLRQGLINTIQYYLKYAAHYQ
jgi:dTDP-glucose 4,6-dehydratase/UDP-glucose 4-epimerase